MSLDLNNRVGLSFNTAALAATMLAGVTTADFDGGAGEAGSKFALYIDTSGGDLDASDMPTNLVDSNGAALFEDGATLTIIKATADGNTISWTEPAGTPLAGTTVAFVDKQVERICVCFDGAAQMWRFV